MANRIRELRKEKGLTLSQLAKELKEKQNFEISSDALSKYERSEREPKLNTWQEISSFFDVPTSYLQGISNIRENNILNNGDNFIDYFKVKNGLHKGNAGDEIWIDSEEIKNFFREKDISRFKLIKDLFLKNSDLGSEQLNKYKGILCNLAQENLANIDEIFFFLNGLFEISMKSHCGDKKALEYMPKIEKLIEEFYGITEDDKF